MQDQQNSRNPYTAPAAPAAGESPPRRRWWWKLAIAVGTVIAVVCLIVSSLQSLYERVVPSAASGRSTSMEPIDLELADKRSANRLKLRIPKAYLIYAKNWRGGQQGFVSLSARIPTMQPATLWEKIGPEERPANDSTVSIFLKESYVDGAFLDRYYKSERRRFNKAQSPVFGLERYLYEVCHPATGECRFDSMEFFAPPKFESAPQRVTLNCDRPDVYPTRICRCRAVTLFKGFIVNYSFHRDRLEDWQAIHEAVLGLLAKFEVS